MSRLILENARSRGLRSLAVFFAGRMVRTHHAGGSAARAVARSAAHCVLRRLGGRGNVRGCAPSCSVCGATASRRRIMDFTKGGPDIYS